MAILAILLLGLGVFGLIIGLSQKDRDYKVGSICFLMAGTVLGVICLIKEDVL